MKLIEFTKKCTKCKTRKSWLKFHKGKGGRFGIRSECILCTKLRDNIHHAIHRERYRTYDKAYHAANREKRNARSRAYSKKARTIHKDRIRLRNLDYITRKRKADPKFRLRNNIAGAIYRALKGNKNGKSWELVVGYTLEALKNHIESLFTKGMTWKNYGKGGWEIDHKIPVSIFNFTKPNHTDFQKCWALSNLQPMWHDENLKKRNSFDGHFQPSLLM